VLAGLVGAVLPGYLPASYANYLQIWFGVVAALEAMRLGTDWRPTALLAFLQRVSGRGGGSGEAHRGTTDEVLQEPQTR
jgi:hypothetical protein